MNIAIVYPPEYDTVETQKPVIDLITGLEADGHTTKSYVCNASTIDQLSTPGVQFPHHIVLLDTRHTLDVYGMFVCGWARGVSTSVTLLRAATMHRSSSGTSIINGNWANECLDVARVIAMFKPKQSASVRSAFPAAFGGDSSTPHPKTPEDGLLGKPGVLDRAVPARGAIDLPMPPPVVGDSDNLAPPLGVNPRWLHEENRYTDLLQAVIRYIEAGRPPLVDWVLEMAELQPRLSKAYREGQQGK